MVPASPVCTPPMVYLDCRNATPGTAGAGCQKSCFTLDMDCVSAPHTPGDPTCRGPSGAGPRKTATGCWGWDTSVVDPWPTEPCLLHPTVQLPV